MDLHDSNQSGIEIIRFWLPRIHDLNRVGPSRYGENRTLIEVLGELVSIQSRRCDDEFQIRSPFQSLLEKPKKNIGGDRPLMCFVKHNHRVSLEIRI